MTLADMLVAHPRSRGQLVFVGLLLCLLVILWLRAADLLYALFFGLLPFPGYDLVLGQLLTTPRGWALIPTSSAVGGLFAAFSMAISVFLAVSARASASDRGYTGHRQMRGKNGSPVGSGD